MEISNKLRRKLLWWNVFISFAVLFVLPTASYFVYGFQTFAQRKIFPSIALESIVQTRLGLEILYFLGGYFLLHASFAVLVWWLTNSIIRLFRIKLTNYVLSGSFIMILACAWCYFANSWIYSRSVHSLLVNRYLQTEWGPLLFFLATAAFAMAIVVATVYSLSSSRLVHRARSRLFLLWKHFAGTSTRRLAATVSGVFLTGAALFTTFYFSETPALNNYPDANFEQKQKPPNIILIGFDSLRPDMLHVGNNGGSITPQISSFVRQSANFESVVTPFARTFPAWVSILTGTYPGKHGARFNLIDPKYLDRDVITLGEELQDYGYRTIYATDETRFSNIDQSFGFESHLGPAMGAADFLLGSVNDFPLSNLISNTWLGQVLFPYTFANRAAHVTYSPETFIEYLDANLPRQDGQPVFLAVHLCLSHWPYRWLDSEKIVEPEDPEESFMKAYYKQSLMTLDEQFTSVINMIENKGLLDNALVVALSDHGESFHEDELGFDTVNLINNENMRVRTHGHGTDVLTPSQYEVMLAFRGYGKVEIPVSRISQGANLVDIVPTVLDVLEVESTKITQLDGISLKPWIEDSKHPEMTRYFPIENGFWVPALLEDNPDMDKVFSEGVELYNVLQNGRLVLKDSALTDRHNEKQYGMLGDDWLYAVTPIKNSHAMDEVLFRISPIDSATAPSPAGQHQTLRRELCRHYGAEPAIVNAGLCSENLARQ